MAWYQTLRDTFQHANTSPGGAGSTTGVPTTPAIGTANAWTDTTGGIWSIANNTLVCAGGGSLFTSYLYRPVTEAGTTNQRFVVYCIAPTGLICPALRYSSSDGSSYNCEFSPSNQTIHLFAFSNGSIPANQAAVSITGFNSAHTYALDLQVSGSSPTTFTVNVYDLTALGIANLQLPNNTTGLATVATSTLVDSSGTTLQQSNTAFALNVNSSAYQVAAVDGYNTNPSSSLTCSPPTATCSTSSPSVAITPYLANSTDTLTVSVTGGGTLSPTTAASGSPNTFTKPSTGSGTSTIVYTSSPGGLTAQSVVNWTSAVAPSVTVSPSSVQAGLSTTVTVTGSNVSWTSSLVPEFSGEASGQYPGYSNLSISGSTYTYDVFPGYSTGPLTLGDSLDAATTTLTVIATALTGRGLYLGTSLTYGFNGSNPGANNATRLAAALSILGPQHSALNAGVPGQTISGIQSGLAANLTACFGTTSLPEDYIMLECGHNDFGSGLTLSQVQAAATGLCAAIRTAAPALPLFMTCPTPATNAGYPANFNSLQYQFCQWIVANKATLGLAGVSPFRFNRTLCVDGAEFNPTLWGSDKTHPLDPVYQPWGYCDGYTVRAYFAGCTMGTGGSTNATAYAIYGIPSAPVVGETYGVTIILNAPASAAGVVSFGASSNVSWGATAVAIASGASSGSNTVTFTATGAVTPTVTHTGLGFAGNPTLGTVTPQAGSVTLAQLNNALATVPVTVGGYSTGQDPATSVWGAATRTLSAFSFLVNANATQAAGKPLVVASSNVTIPAVVGSSTFDPTVSQVVLASSQPYYDASGLFVPGVVSGVTSASSITVAFTGSAPTAAALGGLYCSITSAPRAPAKAEIGLATVVDSTHLILDFTTPFGVLPVVGDAVEVG